MANGFGRGFGRGGWGFGFRGSSPPWPFVGIGRGGLPRCGYFFSGPAGIPMPTGYPPYGPGAMPYYGGYGPPPGTVPGESAFGVYGSAVGTPPYGGSAGYPYAPQMTREQELDSLRSQAEMIRGQLKEIDARMRQLETEE